MRRRLLMIAVFGLIGAAISFGSAWGCIFWRVFVAKRYLGAIDGSVVPGAPAAAWPTVWPPAEQVDVTRGFGYERRMAWRQTVEYYDVESVPLPEALFKLEVVPGYSDFGPAETPAPNQLAERLGEQEALAERQRQRNAIAQLLQQRRSSLLQAVGGQLKRATSQSAFWRGSGWPLLCMRSSWLDERTTEFSRTGAVARQSTGFPTDLNTGGWTPGMFYNRGIPWPRPVAMPDGTTMQFTLPLAPIWPAFVVSAATWGAAAWLAWVGARAIRRHFRRLEGCCRHCGYPIGVSDVCTECGRAVRAKTTETAA